MRTFLVIAIFFGGLFGSIFYCEKMRDVASMGRRYIVYYEDSPSIWFAIYETKFGRACYIFDKTHFDCEEI